MYKKIALVIMCLLAFASKSHAVCTTRTNPVNFAANLTKAHSDNAYLQLVSQTIAASSPQPIDSCTGSGPSTFTMNGVTDLTTNSTISKDGYTYYQIPSAKITPSAASANIKVYIAFSIKDNQNTAPDFWINSATTSYEFYNGGSDTRGLRLQDVRLLVSGLGNTAGTYTISNLKLGNFSAKGSGNTTATTAIVLTGATFQITKSTCVINNGAEINVTLPTVLSSSFTAVGQTVGDTSFTVNVSGCGSADTNKTLVALLTDNNDASASNPSGLLKNTYSPNVSVQITDSAGNALPIAPKNINSSNSFFSFGTIGSGGTVSKAFKARYYSNVATVPATLVQAQATITLIYN
ncbi:thin pilus adhesin subunit AcuG [Acinetobacter johnsonii]|uniref:Pilin (Type 1 fimbria component protein) n=1 Tax=Acinetobacter johnsonii TaxID=40214 RepID=A0A1R7QBR8_ACIJO|nr:thin pilus adhesin subunit AcuG [Acinetobacter johnsonii]SJX21719.1 Pilin (type 1 fimbria component protein) [Acinetobacter johnsonii]